MTQHLSLPLFIIIPFLGGFISWLCGFVNEKLSRIVAFVTMLITLIITVQFWWLSKSQVGLDGKELTWLAEYERPWISDFGIQFHLAIDGLSLLMIVLTAFLGVLAVACSWGEVIKKVGFFNLNLLWSLGAVIGVFLAIDLFLFFFFWELMLIPIYFLIALWGHDFKKHTKERAAMKFFVYTQVAGLVLLVGIFGLTYLHYQQTGILTFSYEALLHTKISLGLQTVIMICFFIGFAVKLPVLPLHGWLPGAHAQAPTAGSVDLAGILIKTAAYGLLRFVIPLFPEASHLTAPYFIALGAITLFYGAWLAYSQTDIKRLLAYTSISHMGLVLIAVYSGNLISLQGVVIICVAQGLTSSALFIISGQVYERYHTRDLRVLAGMWGSLRYLPAFMMFFSVALLGLPGTGDFIGEILIFFGAFDVYPWTTAIIIFSTVFSGIYALILIHRTLYGTDSKVVTDLNIREKLILCSLLIPVVWIGVAPQTLLNTSKPAMEWIHQTYTAVGGF